jgi:hypothetical protein
MLSDKAACAVDMNQSVLQETAYAVLTHAYRCKPHLHLLSDTPTKDCRCGLGGGARVADQPFSG